MKPYIFTIALIFSFGLLSCSSDDNGIPEPPTPVHPLDVKWTLIQRNYYGFGNPYEYFNANDLNLQFLTEDNKVRVELNFPGHDTYPDYLRVFPFYQEGEYDFEVNDIDNILTFYLDYIPPNWGSTIYEDSYRIENDTLVWGKKFSNPDDSAGTEWFFIRM